MDLEKLKAEGKNIARNQSIPHQAVQGKVLAIVRKATKNGESLTQKEVATKLGKILDREIRPQQARSALKGLAKKGKVVSRYMEKPDDSGNRVFWYSI